MRLEKTNTNETRFNITFSVDEIIDALKAVIVKEYPERAAHLARIRPNISGVETHFPASTIKKDNVAVSIWWIEKKGDR